MAPDCTEPTKKCLIDPIDLEHRLTSIEGKLDSILEKPAQSTGLSTKWAIGIQTVITGVVIGVIEYFKGNTK
jgi:tetrahydromethanopterin S-methyltransferase subunit G